MTEKAARNVETDRSASLVAKRPASAEMSNQERKEVIKAECPSAREAKKKQILAITADVQNPLLNMHTWCACESLTML